jgi:quercetin dioxygenase-like cupin family protein
VACSARKPSFPGIEPDDTIGTASPQGVSPSTNEPMPRYSYPHTIDNGAGERITFLRCIPLATGDRLEGENVTQPGAGPPMHVHHRQDEVFTVLAGRLGYQKAGEPERFAGPGETVAFRAGEPHRFWNAGSDALLSTAYVEPADNVEYLLTQLFESASRNGGTRPDPFDAAFLLTRYRDEFEVLEIPRPVQRALFPFLVTVGKLLGKYRRFADAPRPVGR